MSTFDTILRPIETEFDTFRKMQDDLAVNPNPLLREIILHVNKQRGKQMRPMMVLLFSKMFGEVSDTTYSAALAVKYSSKLDMIPLAFRIFVGNLHSRSR